MRRMPWATLLWPGLPQLWLSGVWSGLGLAAGFAILVSLLLMASFVWVELLRPLDVRLGWLAAGTLWGGSATLSFGFARRGAQPVADPSETLFRESLSEYLHGNWFEAETQLTRLLARQPRDVEARLLLATLLRRTRRTDEAEAQLDRLERLADARRWAPEIAAERHWNARSSESHDEPASNDTTSELAARQAA